MTRHLLYGRAYIHHPLPHLPCVLVWKKTHGHLYRVLCESTLFAFLMIIKQHTISSFEGQMIVYARGARSPMGQWREKKQNSLFDSSTVQARLILSRSHHKRRSRAYRTLADLTSFTSGRSPCPAFRITPGIVGTHHFLEEVLA